MILLKIFYDLFLAKSSYLRLPFQKLGACISTCHAAVCAHKRLECSSILYAANFLPTQTLILAIIIIIAIIIIVHILFAILVAFLLSIFHGRVGFLIIR